MRRDKESTLDTVAAGANVDEAPVDDGVGDTLAGDTTASSMFAVPVERERERSSPGVSGLGYEVACPGFPLYHLPRRKLQQLSLLLSLSYIFCHPH